MFLKELASFAVLLTVLLGANGRGTQNNYFQFVEMGQNGVAYDTVEPHNHATSTDTISPPVSFQDRKFYTAMIRPDGRIYFGYDGTGSPIFPFRSYTGDNYIIAPFWDNVYLYSGNRVVYEIHSERDYSYQSQQLMTKVSLYIMDALGPLISVESLLVVEWSGLRSSVNSQKTNKFQALIASSSNGESYVIFTYKCGELQWSTQSSTIGYKGYSVYRNHLFSRSDESPNPIACVNEDSSPWSNLVYRIDSTARSCAESYEFGCTDGTCRSLGDRCDQYYYTSLTDCTDGSDEIGCTTDFCSSGYSCSSGGCVKSSYRCDGEDDCSDGSDESNCESLSVSGYIGIVAAGAVTVLLFCLIIIGVVIHQVKQRNRRRAQFQRLRSEVTVRPQATPAAYTVHFHPKPDEWYQTIEGHWVQGPPPAYSPGEGNSPSDEGNPQSGDEIELIGGFGDSAAVEYPVATVEDQPAESQTQATVEVEPVIEQSTEMTSPADPDNTQSETETASANEVGVASEEGNSLEASSSDNEDTPLIES